MKELDDFFIEKVEGNLKFSKLLGNSYCSSVFYNLMCSLMNSDDNRDAAKRIAVFSYGSGSMATFFSLKYSGEQLNWLKDLKTDIEFQLADRIKITPMEYELSMNLRKDMHGKSNWDADESDLKDFKCGTFYLSQIDSDFRRFYACKE